MLFKFKTKEERLEAKRLKALAKAEAKERENRHLELIERDILSRKEEKVAPEDCIISLKDVNKVYPNHVQAVYDFNLDIKENEFIILVGPSGCGKSTTLRMIAGLEEITCGDLFINGKFSNDIEAKNRDIAMVFQNYALYPNMTVYENMAFSLLMHRHPKSEIDQKVKAAAEILGLSELLDRKPAALSGGQRQRVALGRAIVRNSKIFLMDEPLSNLDAKLRVQMRSEIVKLHKNVGATTIYVTHDQTEAMTMADRIVVMNKGYIQQIGTPKEIYNNPVNKFVATFIGSPAMNILEAEYDNGLIKFENGYQIQLEEERIKKHDNFYRGELIVINKEIDELNSFVIPEKEKNKEGYELLIKNRLSELNTLKEEYEAILNTKRHFIEFGIRPEDVHSEESSKLISKCTPFYDSFIVLTELLGNQYFVHTTFGSKDLVCNMFTDKTIEANTDIKLCFNSERIHIFDKTSEKKII